MEIVNNVNNILCMNVYLYTYACMYVCLYVL